MSEGSQGRVSQEAVQALVEQFAGLGAQVGEGKAGRDFSVVEEEIMGYQDTALESSLWTCGEALLKALEGDPSLLGAGRLEAILQGVLDLRPAIGGYRARLMMYAGDYGDDYSPMARLTKRLLEGVSQALRSMGPSGRWMLSAVPQALLETQINVFYTIGPCETADLKEPLAYHLEHL